VPISSVVVDPQNAGTVYLVQTLRYFTTQVASCTNLPSYCWTKFGTDSRGSGGAAQRLPGIVFRQVLTQAPMARNLATALWTAAPPSHRHHSPDALTFVSQVFGLPAARSRDPYEHGQPAAYDHCNCHERRLR